ncbi:MAG: hypothetical protein ACOYOU_21515 [Kiritimatiellia bacterium]
MDATQTANSDASTTGGAAVKPGYKTTEFWMTAGATFVGLAIASGIVPETGVWPKVVGLVVAAFTSMGYTVSRGMAKKG